jgi:hypothetical protein
MGRKILGLMVLASVLTTLAGCNAGPFGGSTHVWDVSGRRVWTGDGHKASLSADHGWDFVRVRSDYQWAVPDGRSWRPDQVVRACEAVSRSACDAQPDSRGNLFYQFPSTRTIVCLDPVVVVIAPVPHTADSLELGSTGNDLAYVMKVIPGQIRLPSGYRYGRTVARDAGLRWFSPTLSPEPRPLLVDGEPAPIELPEGRLTFSKRSGVYLVGWERPEGSS